MDKSQSGAPCSCSKTAFGSIGCENKSKKHGLEPHARGQKLHFYLEGVNNQTTQQTIWSSMLVVRSCIFIERGATRRGLELHARGQTLCFDLEGYEKVAVWSPMLVVKSCAFI